MTDTNGYHLAASIRQIEHAAMARLPGGTLMARAAAAVAREAERLLRDLPASAPAFAMVGPGNNGGDALAALSLLADRGYAVRAFTLDDRVPDAADARAVYTAWVAAGRALTPLDELPSALNAVGADALLIDGLFGIGLVRPLSAPAARAAQLTHRIPCPVLAVDVPSGLDADRGSVVGGPRATAVRATRTITFIAAKPGLHTGEGLELAGIVTLDTLDCTARSPDGIRVDRHWAQARLPRRALDSHKGSFGTTLVVGGGAGMTGAALLAANGARAVGAGKVATVGPDGPVFDPGAPQLMSWIMDRPADLDDHLARADAAAVGCGLGTGAAARTILARVLACDLPVAVDADALTLAAPQADASIRERLRLRAQHFPTVLTPHPLEAARLLGSSVQEVQADRIAAAHAIAREFGSVVLLKGGGTVLAAPDGRWGLIASGNPALATGGTGDILAGMVAGLMSQSLSAWESAAIAAWAHGDAADNWAISRPGRRGLAASALLDHVVESINFPQASDGRP